MQKRGGGHTEEQPLPPAEAASIVELEDARSKQRANGIAAKHAKEEDGNSLGQFLSRVPGGQGVDGAGDVSSLGESQSQARDQKPRAVLEANLEGCDQAKDKDLAGYPLSRAQL